MGHPVYFFTDFVDFVWHGTARRRSSARMNSVCVAMWLEVFSPNWRIHWTSSAPCETRGVMRIDVRSIPAACICEPPSKSCRLRRARLAQAPYHPQGLVALRHTRGAVVLLWMQ